jgi:polysaccharide deacetylase family sporulation protein PdaB
MRRGVGRWAGLAVLLLASTLALARSLKNRQGAIYWHGDLDEKKVALTFDDGPNEPYTSQVLKILKDNNVKATFFMVGKNVEFFPLAAKAVAEGGHVIGNHSYDHPIMVLERSRRVHDEIARAGDAILKATGQEPYLFRNPYGAHDGMTLIQAEKLGYICIQWSVSSKDWERPGVQKIINNVIKHVHNGGIILMHDGDKTLHGGDRSQTVQALSEIIRRLKEEGYEFVTVPQLLKIKPPDEPAGLGRSVK